MNRLWRLCERVGVAQTLRKAYFTLHGVPRGWRYRSRVGDLTADFRTTTWYEFKRARGFYGETPVLESFVSNLRTDDVVWDVGANVGLYACFAAKKLETGMVVGFEPIPRNRRRLVENLRANAPPWLWRASPHPLSDSNGPSEMAFDHDASMRTLTGAGHHYLTDDDGWIDVECRRGDHLVADGLPAPDVLKIDVQGAELNVLRGLGDSLDDVRVLYVEIHQEKSRRYDTTPEDLERFLREAGFSLSSFGPPRSYRHGVYHVLARRPESLTDPAPSEWTRSDQGVGRPATAEPRIDVASGTADGAG